MEYRNTQIILLGLCSGTYTLNITDAVGCIIDTSITIGQVSISGCTDPLAIVTMIH